MHPDRNSFYCASYGTGFKSAGTNTDSIANGFNPIFNAEKSQSFEVGLKKDFEISDSIYAYIMGEYSHTDEIVLDGSNDPLAVQDSYELLNLRFYMNFVDYDLDVIVWGRNVLDEEYINRTNFPTTLQEGKLNAYMAEPATFGVTVKKRF